MCKDMPYQSWQNVAEWVISTLNLAVQNVSLARNAMLKGLNNLLRTRIPRLLLEKLLKIAQNCVLL